MPTTRIIPEHPLRDLIISNFPSILNNTDALLYSKGGGRYFDSLPNDLVSDGFNWHKGNPLVMEKVSIKSCKSLDISVEEKNIYSESKSAGLFNIIEDRYYWNNVITSPLGIYFVADNTEGFNFKVEGEKIYIKTNDINTVPRPNDFIIFNEIPFGKFTNSEIESINNKITDLPFVKQTYFNQVQIVDVTVLSGTGVNVEYLISIDKFISFENSNSYSIVLLNRKNTSIQKDMFYNTFEALEIHRKQLLGDPYNNILDINKPYGRTNFLSYNNFDSLGYSNLLRNIVKDETPLFIFEINEEVKDRISFLNNSYSSLYNNIHFELKLPSLIVSECFDDGEVRENTLIQKNTKTDQNLGVYSEMYFRWDLDLTKRIGFVFNDLRLVVIDEPEIATALGYNSNRNFILPKPKLKEEFGNIKINEGVNINLEIINATDTSPIVVTTSINHSLTRGTRVYINNVLGNTATNGEYFVDTASLPNQLKLYVVMPTYNSVGIMTHTGTPSEGSGSFIPSITNPGRILSALPQYSYFYTYRIRTKYDESVLPYANKFDFNFTKSNQINNTDTAQLHLFIPRIETSNKVGNNSINNLGFKTMDFSAGYGIDIIVGKYETDTIDPSKIVGFKDIVFIPITELEIPFDSISQTIETGMYIQVSMKDYKDAILNPLRKYDILNVTKIYNNVLNELPESLLTSNGNWTIGNIVYKNNTKANRATFEIKIPADKWNGTTNPTFSSTENMDGKDKFITEIAIINEGDLENKPLIYTKIAPPIRKTSNLDLNINFKIDF